MYKKNIEDAAQIIRNIVPESQEMTMAQKWEHYEKVIAPHYESKGQEVPWHLEPDAFEGWK